MSIITLEQVLATDIPDEQKEIFKLAIGESGQFEVTSESLFSAKLIGLDIGWLIARTLVQLEDQQAVLDSKNPEWCYYFAVGVPGADIKALQQLVLDCKDAKWCYHFAAHIPGADIKVLQQVVIDSKNPRWCYRFARRVSGADIQSLQQVVLDSKDPDWCYYFAQGVPGADKTRLMAIK